MNWKELRKSRANALDEFCYFLYFCPVAVLTNLNPEGRTVGASNRCACHSLFRVLPRLVTALPTGGIGKLFLEGK